MLLAFDTSSPQVTVALADGDDVVAEQASGQTMKHGEQLAPLIAAVLDSAGRTRRDLTAIGVGVGPGPFTGLRVGLVTARTMSATLGIPVTGICTLDIVAAAVQSDEGFLVATDARRKEVYWARYAASGARHTEPSVDRPGDVATGEPVAGRGATLYPDAFPNPIAPEYPNAADLARLVLAGSAIELPPEPLYLRRPDVAEPGARKRVS